MCNVAKRFFPLRTVAGADSPGGKQFRAAGGQGEQPSAREVSRHPGQLFRHLQPLLEHTAYGKMHKLIKRKQRDEKLYEQNKIGSQRHIGPGHIKQIPAVV